VVIWSRGRPASITAEVTISLDRPRDQITTKELLAYLEFRHAAHMALRGADGHR